MKRNISIAFIVLLLTITFSNSSFADDFGLGNSDTGNRADNGWHDYCTSLSYPATWTTPIDDAMRYLDSSTVMTTFSQATCANWTDAQFRVLSNAEMGSQTRGATQCMDNQLDPISHICGGASIFLKSSLLTSYGQRRKTICHEVGHSVGLTHSLTTTDCMISGSSTVDWYGTHHLAHINATY